MPASCSASELTPPLYEYPQVPTRCSITGGVVSRDPRLPHLIGLYLWTDLRDKQLYAIDRSARTIAERPLRLPVKEPTGFGTGALNGISVTTTEGNFYRLDPRS
jgi:hypothetical protein